MVIVFGFVMHLFSLCVIVGLSITAIGCPAAHTDCSAKIEEWLPVVVYYGALMLLFSCLYFVDVHRRIDLCLAESSDPPLHSQLSDAA